MEYKLQNKLNELFKDLDDNGFIIRKMGARNNLLAIKRESEIGLKCGTINFQTGHDGISFHVYDTGHSKELEGIITNYLKP